MEDLLHGEGKNYSVFIRTYRTDFVPGVTIQEIMQRMLGDKAIIEDIRDVNFSEVERELRAGFSYSGNDDAGPAVTTLESAQFRVLLEEICEEAKLESHRSTGLKTFRFKDGHPAYPVFWDFAFLFIGDSKCELLVGSSSD